MDVNISVGILSAVIPAAVTPVTLNPAQDVIYDNAGLMENVIGMVP